MRLDEAFRLFNFLQSPSLIWITESDFLLSLNVMWWSPTMSFVTLGPGCEVLKDGDSQIQISKNGLQLKLKLI